MRYIIIPIGYFLLWVITVVFGILYNVLYFIWNPKAMIDEKKKSIIIDGNGSIQWWATITRFDFWIPDNIMS